ncbi:MAG: glycosyltransferase family 2 protein [Planctomycetes bacterium]|nr:glycosyltransferase family 2 protein [Planctomycetota bacterium]
MLASVIITTYKRPAYLFRAVCSVLAQSLTDFEVIIVDDSPDSPSEEAISSLLSDRRIHYHRNERNLGGGASRNVGLEFSTGEYVCFLDDDDVWLPDRLLLAARALRPSTIWSSVGWEWREDATGRLEKRRVANRTGRVAGLPRWMHNIAVDYLVQREVALTLPTSETLNYYIPMEFICRLFKVAPPVFVPEVLISCRTHPGERTSTRSARAKLDDIAAIRRLHGDLLGSDRAADAHFLTIEAALLEEEGHCMDAAFRYARAAALRPNLKNPMRGARAGVKALRTLVRSGLP